MPSVPSFWRFPPTYTSSSKCRCPGQEHGREMRFLDALELLAHQLQCFWPLPSVSPSWLSCFSWACYSSSFVVFCLQTGLLLKCGWGFEMTSRVKLSGSCLFELILCWQVRDSEGGQSSGLKSGSLSLFLKLLAFLKLGLWGPGNILLYRPHQWFMRAFVLDLLGSVTEKCSGQKANFGTVRGFTSWHQHTFSFLAEDQLYKEPYGKTSLEKKESISLDPASQERPVTAWDGVSIGKIRRLPEERGVSWDLTFQDTWGPV